MAVTLNANSSTGFIATSDTSGVLQLQTGGTTAVTVDASQNVGIGTASPAYRLDVSGDAQLTNGNYMRWKNSSGTSVAMLGLDGSNNFLYGPSGAFTGAHLFYGSGGTERMRINAGAPILCLSGGNTSATGTGIAFPATQSASTDANTLDDYEEGTWTPSLLFGGSAGVTTYSIQNGSYTKVGNVVTVRAYFLITTKSAATGTAVLAGLPFAAKSGSNFYQGGGAVYASGMTSLLGALMAYTAAGETSTNLGYTASTGFGSLTNSNFNNGADLMFQLTYITN